MENTAEAYQIVADNQKAVIQSLIDAIDEFYASLETIKATMPDAAEPTDAWIAIQSLRNSGLDYARWTQLPALKTKYDPQVTTAPLAPAIYNPNA